MKFAKVQPYHTEYIEYFYGKRPELKRAPYSEQLEAINYDSYLWSDFWSNAMSPMGYECIDLIPNITFLQRAWAKENHLPFDEVNEDLEGIAIKQLLQFGPEIVFLYQSSNDKFIGRLREEIPTIKLLLYWAGSPVPKKRNLEGVDIVLTCSPELLDQTISRGIETHLLSHSFEPRINERLRFKVKESQLIFSGRLSRIEGYHFQREKILQSLAGRIPLRILTPSYYYSMGFSEYTKVFLKKLAYYFSHSLSAIGFPNEFLSRIPSLRKSLDWKKAPSLPVNHKMKKIFEPPVYGLDMFQALHDASISLNIHGDLTKHVSAMRVFEATGVGSCLLTDWKEDIHDYFIPDYEVVTFKTVDECIEKVRWLLENENKRAEIAQAGQRKTLNRHTFADRALVLDEIIRHYIRKNA